MSRTAKRIVLALIVIIVLGIFLPPFVNVNRYRGRIAEAISNGMGRQVTIGQISLRLLPQPGFVLENLVVADDPVFSAEPLLRADEVTASLRLSSLWRGRLEIARLSLKYPSLNLVLTPDNKLNLEALLSRATRTPTAPTTAKRPQSRARFPYIEAEGGRINFKRGLEKEVFALIDTDFALWSPWEDEWRMRIESRPVRTDVAISDTGTLKIDGSFHRAENLLNTPVNISFSLERIQLGQLTKLVSGRDRGWRGGLNVDGKVTGNAGAPRFTMHATVDDFRRYDIVRGEALRLDVQCSGQYVSRASQVGAAGDSGLWLCKLPLGNGSLQMETALSNSLHEFSMKVLAKDLPMNSVVAFARHAKRDLPEDLTASGVVNGAIEISRNAQNPSAQITGEGSATAVALKSSLLGKDLVLGNLSLEAAMPAAPASRSRKALAAVAPNPVPRLNIRQFPVAIGGPVPANVNGWITRDGYGFDLAGEAEMSRLLQVARTLGIGVPKMGIFGPAHVQVELAGQWKGFTQPTATGTASLKNVRAEVPGIASPVLISSAMATLAANDIRLQSASGSVEKLAFGGSAIFPRHCDPDVPCISRFEIQADELDLEAINQLVNPRLKKRAWYKMFGGDAEQSLLASAEATGRLIAKRVVLGTLSANRVLADFRLDKGDLRLDNVRADLLGGTHTGQWTANFNVSPPAYAGSGTLSRALLAQVASLTHDPWGTGIFSASYDLSIKGWNLAELVQSAQGTAVVHLRDGSLRHIALDSHGSPLRVVSLDARLSLAKSILHIDQSRMQTPNGIYDVSGTATLNRTLEFTLQRDGVPAYTVTGTLEKPQVTAAPTRQAEVSVRP